MSTNKKVNKQNPIINLTVSETVKIPNIKFSALDETAGINVHAHRKLIK